MPMWLYKRRPTPPPKPVAKTTAAEMSHALQDAIARNDVNSARQVFEKAFWDKVEFRADGYHLLQAVRRDNRDMVRLLITHGATWTPVETKTARMISGAQWENAASELRRAGIRTQFSEAELKDIDPVTAIAWATRSVEDAERRGASDAAQSREDLARIGATSVTLLAAKGDMPRAIALFKALPGQGDGSQARPLDAARVFAELVKLEQREPRLALRFLDALKARDLAVKPLALTGTELWLTPSLVPALKHRDLLAGATADSRLNLLHNWSLVQATIDTGNGVFQLDAAYVAKQQEALRKVAQVLFPKTAPVTPTEAQDFLSLHEMRRKQTPQALAQMEAALLETGFFDSPAFTAKNLRQLAGTVADDTAGKNLASTFNRLAAARLMIAQPLDSFLYEKHFHEIETAHRLGAYRATAYETVKIVDYLATQVKKDVVPDSVMQSLKVLRDGGADFSRVNPNRYLGKKAPGLCKTLLDLGVVSARSIDVELIAKRHNGELRPLTPPGGPDYADQEFMAQVLLEIASPEKYIPLRGEQGSYLQRFLREYASGRIFKRKFGTRSTGPR